MNLMILQLTVCHCRRYTKFGKWLGERVGNEGKQVRVVQVPGTGNMVEGEMMMLLNEMMQQEEPQGKGSP